MMSSVEWTDLDFKISVALEVALIVFYLENVEGAFIGSGAPVLKGGNMVFKYCHDPKFLDRQDLSKQCWPWSESTLFAIQSASSQHITEW